MGTQSYPVCPECDGPTSCDEADVGVGVIQSRAWCENPKCRWEEPDPLEALWGIAPDTETDNP